MAIVRGVLVTALAFAVAACGRYPDQPVQPPRDAGTSDRTVLHRNDPAHVGPLAEIATVDAGEPAPLVNRGETIGSLEFTGLKVGGEDSGPNVNSGPWMTATVHIENWSHKEAILPAAGIRCAGSTGEGDLLIGRWPADVEATEEHPLPAGRSTDWNVILSLPADVGPGRACRAPVFVAITALGDFVEKDPVSRVRIPVEVIDELNATLACADPLPTC